MADPLLSTEIRDWNSRLMLLQDRLFFAEPALPHLRLLSTESNSNRGHSEGQGQDLSRWFSALLEGNPNLGLGLQIAALLEEERSQHPLGQSLGPGLRAPEQLSVADPQGPTPEVEAERYRTEVPLEESYKGEPEP